MPVQRVSQYLPYLRRYARALTGSQVEGDGLVQAMLERAVTGKIVLLDQPSPRVGLFRAFTDIWRERRTQGADTVLAADQRLQELEPGERAALLLTLMEGFSMADAAVVLDLALDEVERRVSHALKELDQTLATDVLIIEDEPIIALDLERLVEDLGHRVLGIAHTRAEGVALAERTRPGLVLADVHLADGSSGLDTAMDILRAHDVPVIFITAYPERLLTGERPEPAYLISKPYEDDQVKAVVGQALFFHQPRQVEAA